MKEVRSVKNQYRGINAHLHSFWQGTGTWNRFHSAYIIHLMESLQEHLIPLGYIAEVEEALQVRRMGGDFPYRPKSDVVIYDTNPQRSGGTAAASNADLTVADLIEGERDTDHPYGAIAIYPLSAAQEFGEPIAWIEVLSPTNKGYSDDAYAYRTKRRALVDSGIVFVEIDYLHETPPTFSRFLDYTDPSEREAGASPYRIVVLDPRPNVKEGPAIPVEFAVDSPIPTMTIPLSGENKIAFDFGHPYQQMFERALYGYTLDYAQLPMNFDRYSLADQGRIAARMIAIMEAVMRGEDLERDPLPVQPITTQDELSAALTHIEGLKQSLMTM